MDIFDCRTRIFYGENTLERLAHYHGKSVLLVADPYFVENGWAEKILNMVDAPQKECFSHICPDPTVELAAEGTAVLRQANPDLLIALGGGSAMDTAKAMVYFGAFQGRFVAIPTTSGSGSEVTDFAILTHGQVKHPLVDKRLLPQEALLVTELVEKLPGHLVADGGFDVLSHALESWVAKGASPFTKALAGTAFALAFQQLPASYRGEGEARRDMHLASCMAGMAFSGSGLGLCHALSHSLGGLFHLPHGRLNAILLPEVVQFNGCPAYRELARLAGLEASSDTMAIRNLRNGLVRLRKDLHLPGSLLEAGISRQKLQQNMGSIVEATLKDPCMDSSPVQASAQELKGILEAASG